MWLRLIFCVCLPLVTGRGFHCYWNNKNPYTYFGSKTPYEAVRGDFRDVPPMKGCEPVNVWFITRHGTRHPSPMDAAAMKEASALKYEIIKSYKKGRGEMCAQDISDLQNWKWTNLDDNPSILTQEGFDELLAFGQRFREKFSSFLDNLNQSRIRSTDEKRTRKSAKGFIKGLKDIGANVVVDDPIREDAVARPYRFCKKRGGEVINSTQASEEISRYQEAPEFKELQQNVQKRIGIDHELHPRTIMGFYDLCRFYRAYSIVKRSPWCALFTDNDLQILEYVEDIRHYFRNGYGHPMNRLLGASGLKDLYEKFEATVSSGYKSFIGYFSHDTMLDMIYTAMGLYYDYPEISGFERIRNRKWRTSFLTPFVANFVAVLHRCTKMSTYKYRIQFFVNEKEVHICGNRVCGWNDFREKFEQFSNASIDFCDESTTLYYV
ncbi:multiple inositol polyphosphate phosphatase 1-like [Nymphalis io]|uniref:multiple inositol polyphosphate phosphatase 1-like n=1 Tax=Inachis io TaxID=171585 RepID=UPI002166F7A5|nr:multiple inositol polyphosphate phosphatase 1-like [Nymphalis io]